MMRLTPHYQQQVKQSTSHFSVLPAKVLIHFDPRNCVSLLDARVCLSFLLHIFPLLDRDHHGASASVSHIKEPIRASL